LADKNREIFKQNCKIELQRSQSPDRDHDISYLAAKNPVCFAKKFKQNLR